MSHDPTLSSPVPGEGESVAPVVNLWTGLPVVPGSSRVPQPSGQGAAGVLSGEVLPAAGSRWEAIRLRAELPVVPSWLRSGELVRQRAWWLARAGGRVAVSYVWQSPVIAARCGPPVGRGTARAARAYKRWATARRLYEEAADLRGEASKSMWEEARERARKARKMRLVMSVLGLPVAGVGVWIGGLVWGPLIWWGLGAAAAVSTGVAGRRPGERILGVKTPKRPVELGMSAGQLHATIGEVMAALKLDVSVLRSQAHPWGWDVQVMAGQALDKVADKVDEIEARLRTRTGAVSLIPDASDAGMATLRIVWSDPYAAMPPPVRRAPGSVSARGAHPVGRMLDGQDLRLPLLAHTVYVGKSRSGKSSAVWTVLDILTAANDVVVWGGDLSDAPALNIWGDCVQHYRSTPAGLEGLLKVAIAVGMARAAVMGRRLRPTADSVPGQDVVGELGADPGGAGAGRGPGRVPADRGSRPWPPGGGVPAHRREGSRVRSHRLPTGGQERDGHHHHQDDGGEQAAALLRGPRHRDADGPG